MGSTLIPKFNGGTVTSPILLQDGTAAAPSLAFASDADGSGTGVYRSAADTMIHVSNGAPKLTVAGELTFNAAVNFSGALKGGFATIRVLADNTTAPSTSRDYWLTNQFTAARTKPLPAASTGFTVRLIDDDAASRLTITPGAGDEIIWTDGTVVSAATGSIAFGARYQFVELVAIDVTTWVVTNAVARGGAFTVTP